MTNFSVQSELQDEIVEAIRKCSNRNMQQDEIQALFPNQVLRDDVLELLTRTVTVKQLQYIRGSAMMYWSC